MDGRDWLHRFRPGDEARDAMTDRRVLIAEEIGERRNGSGGKRKLFERR